MRSITLVAAIVLAVGVCVSCDSSTSTPVSPTAAAQSFVVGVNGTQPAGTSASGSRLAAAPVGLTGVIRGLDVRAGIFSLVTRPATRTILVDSETQVWNRGTRVRLSSLRDRQSVSIRGYDYTRYVLARSIGAN